MASVAVILPAYNEELTIKGVIEDFHKHLPQAQIVVVNNNSKDRTEAIARETLLSQGIQGQVINEPRQGKGNAMRRAFTEVDADIYVLADADLTYPASHAPDLIKVLQEQHADMVVGDRHSGGHYAAENKRALHGFGNNLVKNLINKLFRANLSDMMSGYRIFTKRFVKNYPILVSGFQVEVDMTLHALDKRFYIVEVPIVYKDRPEGSTSKLNTISDGFKVLFAIAQIFRYYKPLTFFSTASIITAFVGLLIGIPVIQDWIQHQYIYRVPLAILAASVEVLALILMGIGLNLDSITHQQKLNFELQLLKWKKQ